MTGAKQEIEGNGKPALTKGEKPAVPIANEPEAQPRKSSRW